MRPHCSPTILALVSALALSSVRAQVRVQPDGGMPPIFSGGQRLVVVRLNNPAKTTTNLDARVRLLQTSTATVVRIAELPWKHLELLPGQTVVESAAISFPAVEAETKFLIQWLGDVGHVIGLTEVLVYPTNLLAQFKSLAGGEPLGVFDPANELKPLLRAQSVAYQDLVEEGTDKFHGKLAVFGPFVSRNQMRESLADDIRVLAKRGVAVVWLQPPSKPRAPFKPSFYSVSVDAGVVVVAQAGMVSRLADNPEAQLNLIRLAELALRPEPLDLPESQKPD